MDVDGRKLLLAGLILGSLFCGLPGLGLCGLSGMATLGFLVDGYTTQEYIQGAVGIGLFACLGALGIAVPFIMFYFWCKLGRRAVAL